MLDVVLRVKPKCSWVSDVEAIHGVPIAVFSPLPYGDCGGKSLVEIRSDEEGVLEEVTQTIESHPDVRSFSVIESSESRILGSVVASEWPVCSTLVRSDCFPKHGRSKGKGWADWEMFVFDQGSLAALRAELESEGCAIRLIRKREVRGVQALTERQESVLRKALEFGYYDFPRRITGAQLAKRLGVSRSTLSETLQRAERKLVDFYLHNRLHVGASGIWAGFASSEGGIIKAGASTSNP
ncbi:MAG TPA: helix-turn-helix domain-containing protein [Methanomassiliicoccales archaeon]|nr:helix-turn-helix domain-containing protein [Methanomassiliicoccales archaeon]